MCEASSDFVCLFLLCTFHTLTKSYRFLHKTNQVSAANLELSYEDIHCIWATKSHHQILSLQQFYYKSPSTPDLMIPSLRNGISSISSKRECLLYLPIYALFLRV